MFNKELLKLYFICGTTTCLGKDLYTVVEDALKGGITLFQFREKGKGALEGKEKVELAVKIQDLCKKYDVPFIVNDDIELALEIDADGVHVGQGDGNIEKMRKLAPEIPIVAIGGIKKEDIKNIAAIGVEGVSIISAISYSESIKQTVEQMINEYKNYVE